MRDAIARGATEEELVDVLCRAYEVDAERARRDVEAFVDSLVSEGITTARETSNGGATAEVQPQDPAEAPTIGRRKVVYASRS